MKPEEFYKLIAEHGGLTGTRTLDPLITDEFGIKSPNPTPIYVYTFNDGTSLAARTETDGSFSITDWGDAGPSKSNSTQKPPAGTTRVVQKEYNGTVYDVTEVADGYGGWSRDTSVEPKVSIAKPAAVSTRTPAQEAADQAAADAARASAARSRATLPADIAKTQAGTLETQAQTAYLQAQAEKLRRENQPPLGLLLDNHMKTIDQVQAMLASGELKSVAEADAILDLANQNLRAAMQGASPFQMAKQRQDTDTQRAQIGQSIVNQRLQTGGTLAQSLMNMFSNNLDTLGWGLQPGQTVGFDPFALARSYTDEMGGGAEVGELGKMLLSQLHQPAPGGSAASPAPSAAGYSAPNNGGLPAGLALAVQMAEEADRRGVQQPQEVMANG
jgi:hypothetical protein